MITLEELHRLLDYDPETGIFRWREKRAGTATRGSIAGRLNWKGYRQISLCNGQYQEHRLAWFYVHGVWPDGQIDHINRNPADNRLANLRIATPSQNGANKAPAKTGLKGTTKLPGGWQAQLKWHQRTIYLGLFPSEQEAHAAYFAAAQLYHGEFARAAE